MSCTEKMHIKVRCIKYTETNNEIKVALINLQWFRVLGASFSRFRGLRFRVLSASFSSFGCFVFDLGCFVFEFWVLRFRDLGASCFVFETTI